MYDELLRAVEQYFDEVKVLKRGTRGTVTLVRHRQRRGSVTCSAASTAPLMSTGGC